MASKEKIFNRDERKNMEQIILQSISNGIDELLSENNLKLEEIELIGIAAPGTISKGVGGKNAIDYLMIVKNLSFINAVQTVLGNMKIQAPVKYEQEEKNHERRLKIPVKASNNARAINYLLSRGIDKEIIQYCIENKLLYQEERTNNVVFIGYDNNKIPSYAFCRATNQERFMREATGSNKKYSFKIKAEKENNIVHLFESSIDLLSFATLLSSENRNWREENSSTGADFWN